MLKRCSVLLIHSLVLVCFSTVAVANETMRDVGKGLQLGGAANGTPVGNAVVVVGILVDILSGAFGSKKLDLSDPEARERFERAWAVQARLAALLQNRQILKPTVNTSPEQIKTQAQSYCADLDKRAATGGTLQMSRKLMKLSKISDDLLPEDDGTDVIQYKLSKNPVPNCVQVLIEDGDSAVCRLNGRKDCDHIVTPYIASPPPPAGTEERRFHDKFLGRGSVSKENVTILNNLLAKSEGVAIQPFESSDPGLRKILCRLNSTIHPPRGLTFARFVEESLVAQLRGANKYARNSQLSLSGTLTAIDFSSSVAGNGVWKMSLEVIASNGRKTTVSSEYEFGGSFFANEACAKVQEAFIPAVDKLMADLINSPNFAAMLAQDAQTQATAGTNSGGTSKTVIP